MFNNKHLTSLHLFASACLLWLAAATHAPLADIPIGQFSKHESGTELPDGWKELKLGKAASTTYKLVEHEGAVVVQATSDGAASGLIREVSIDPQEYPILNWDWKITNVLDEADWTEKEGDDFAARILVTFDYDLKELPLGERLKYKTLKLLGYKDIPLRALNYVWSNNAPAGATTSSAYTDWVTLIALQSGEQHVNTWKKESRNLYNDYIEAFGEAPGAITGVAIMTDTDDTGGSTMAYFGDITVSRE